MNNYYSEINPFCVGDIVVRRTDCVHDGMWSRHMSPAERISPHVIEEINGHYLKLVGHNHGGWVDEYFTLVHSNYKPLEEGEYL